MVFNPPGKLTKKSIQIFKYSTQKTLGAGLTRRVQKSSGQANSQGSGFSVKKTAGRLVEIKPPMECLEEPHN